MRKQLLEIQSAGTEYVLVLSGDHLYRMDYRDYVEFHVNSGADITIAVQPVSRADAPGLGILKMDAAGQITRFTEKPKTDDLLDEMVSSADPDKPYMASMGIYVFATDVLLGLLELEGDDFGKDIIPASIETRRVMGYVFEGFWEDIGTIRRFYEVNLDMTRPDGHFDFYSPNKPIYTSARFLPASEVFGAQLDNVLLTDGCRVFDAMIRDSVIGLRCMIGKQVRISSSVLMGADFFETEADLAENARLGKPNIGIGDGSVIEQAIIDKNARIGASVVIRGNDDRPDAEGDNWFVRDGIVIIPKNAVIPDGMVI